MKDQKTPVSVGEARLRQLFDPGTMSELGAYVCRPGQKEEREGVVCGYGAVDGRLVFAFSQDAAAMKGALDARHVKKIVAVYEKAMAVGAPVVEEVAKVVLPMMWLEKEPWRFRGVWAIVFPCIVSALVFATIENLLYFHIYIPRDKLSDGIIQPKNRS